MIFEKRPKERGASQKKSPVRVVSVERTAHVEPGSKQGRDLIYVNGRSLWVPCEEQSGGTKVEAGSLVRGPCSNGHVRRWWLGCERCQGRGEKGWFGHRV